MHRGRGVTASEGYNELLERSYVEQRGNVVSGIQSICRQLLDCLAAEIRATHH
jgi:hypothetical protein